MATANDIILRAFTRLGIRASETALEADEIQDGLELLNDMLAEWEPLYQLGAAPLSSVSDVVRVPRYAELAIKENLAVRLAPEFSRPLSPALVASAKQSTDNLLNITLNLTDVDVSSTLPMGSGNECNNGDDRRFFPQEDKANF